MTNKINMGVSAKGQKTLKSGWKKFVLAVLVVGCSLAAKAATVTGGLPSGTSTIPQRNAAVGGNSLQMPNLDVGFRVAVATSAAAMQILDESGSAIVSGLIHQICVSSGVASEWAVVYDSNTIAQAGFTVALAPTNAVYQVTPTLNRSTTAERCQTFDTQFNTGAVILVSGVSTGANAVITWRPSRPKVQ